MLKHVDHAAIRRDMRLHAADILKSANFRSSAQNIQHADVSVMKHSLKVAYTSMWLNRKFKLKSQEKDLVRGALLHDYFLYDWHDDDHRGWWNLHGFFHPGVALRNANRDYDLSKREKEIIKKHMWPLTVVPPTCREAWIVTLADKYISTLESLRIQTEKRKMRRSKGI